MNYELVNLSNIDLEQIKQYKLHSILDYAKDITKEETQRRYLMKHIKE